MRTRPVCVQCNVGYVIEKSGVYLVEMFNNPPEPYKIWHADLHVCPACGHEIVSGFGGGPLMEHYQEGFDDYLKSVKDDGYVVLEHELMISGVVEILAERG